MVRDDVYYMREALREAQKGYDAGEIPVGAIVVCGDRIVARAHNLTERLIDVTAHAEMQAITAAAANIGGKYLSDCTMFVSLEPCVMCAGALAWAQLGRLVYGATDEKKGFTLVHQQILHPRTKCNAGLLANESTTLLQQFFKSLR